MPAPGRLLDLATLATLTALLACGHDLDALKAQRDDTGLRAGSGARAGSGGHDSVAGSGHAGSGGAGSDGSAGSEPDSGADAGTPSAGTCDPCPAVTAAAKTLGVRNCCRGATGAECGLTFGEGGVCLPRAVPSQDDSVCPEVTKGSLQLAGCCRPDGRCGVAADQVGLGCVARDEILPSLGLPSPAPIPCVFSCEVDADCKGVAGGFVCAETPDHSARVCANDCARDRDCPRGQICGLSNDIARDRVLAICRDPVGTVEPGAFCSAANDCVHGVCSRLPDIEPFCTQLCVNPPDCPSSAPRCGGSMIPTPSMENTNSFNICLP